MFQVSVTKFFLLLLVAASLIALWLLQSNHQHWYRVLPESEELVVENVLEPESTKNDTFRIKEFVPTNEWQTIQKDQPIPPGLHVQIDLQTGEKKAKLMEEDSINGKGNNLAITHSNKSEDINDSNNVPDNLQHKYKSYTQIKNELKELNMAVKSDMDIVDELSIKFLEKLKVHDDSESDLKNILTDLENLLHQVDTAEVFAKNKGIESIVIPCLNSNSSFMKEKGALLLGSAASNNQKVQIAALESDVISLLLKHINEDYEFAVQKNCFYALSSITRRFPAALKQVIDKNGIQDFMSIFKRPMSSSNTILKVKVSQLIEDLLLELEDAKLTLKEETNEKLISEAKERVKQYDDLHLKDKLVENGWCEILSNEFIILSNPLSTNTETHEMVEASGKSLLAMSKSCKPKLQGNKLLFESLYKLEAYYKKLFQQDNFFNDLYYLVNELTNTYDPILE